MAQGVWIQGIQGLKNRGKSNADWMPTFAGMTPMVLLQSSPRYQGSADLFLSFLDMGLAIMRRHQPESGRDQKRKQQINYREHRFRQIVEQEVM